jgi:hypothetical protein
LGAVSFFLIFILPALSQGLDKVIQRGLVFGIGVESFAALFHGGFVLSRLQVPFCQDVTGGGKLVSSAFALISILFVWMFSMLLP